MIGISTAIIRFPHPRLHQTRRKGYQRGSTVDHTISSVGCRFVSAQGGTQHKLYWKLLLETYRNKFSITLQTFEIIVILYTRIANMKRVEYLPSIISAILLP